MGMTAAFVQGLLFKDAPQLQQVMMEYILIAEVNSSDECAHRLGRLLADCKALVMLNIIPYNPTATGQEWMFVVFFWIEIGHVLRMKEWL